MFDIATFLVSSRYLDLAYNGSDFKIFYWTSSLRLFSVLGFVLFWLLCSSHSSSCIVTYTKINLLVTSFKCRKNSVCRTSLSILFLHIDRSQNILSEYKNNKKFKSWILLNAKNALILKFHFKISASCCTCIWISTKFPSEMCGAVTRLESYHIGE